jgi:hypothetical protein
MHPVLIRLRPLPGALILFVHPGLLFASPKNQTIKRLPLRIMYSFKVVEVLFNGDILSHNVRV